MNDLRAIHRLSNQTFHSAHTYRTDDKLPTWDLYYSGTKVQDSTVEFSDGTYISKYDRATQINVPKAKLWGVYGDDFGCWFVQPSQEYVNGDQLKQELMVHMEAQTGDIAFLNMLAGGHYQIDVDRTYDEGRLRCPWLWYLNDGNVSDAEERLEQDISTWP